MPEAKGRCQDPSPINPLGEHAAPPAPTRDFVTRPPGVMDRIAFMSHDGPRTGYVAALRRYGEGDEHGGQFAWVELEHDPAGRFCAVPLLAVTSADGKGSERRQRVDPQLWRRLALCDFGDAGEAAPARIRLGAVDHGAGTPTLPRNN